MQQLLAVGAITDSFTAVSSHGSASKQVTFTIHGTNDAAVIGDPTVADVTEDVSVDNGNLTASGTISITDVDHGQASFQTSVTGAEGNLRSLTLAADGGHNYNDGDSTGLDIRL